MGAGEGSMVQDRSLCWSVALDGNMRCCGGVVVVLACGVVVVLWWC